MGSFSLLLGRTRSRRLAALREHYLAAVDGFGRPAFLHIVDTPRRKDAIEREFLRAQGAIPSFEPRVEVLSELLDALAERHGGGRAVLSDRALGLLAQRVLTTDAASRWPWLRLLGASAAVGEAIAALHQQLAEHDRDALAGAPHEPELRALFAELDRALSRLPGHRTRAEALSALLPLCDDPPPALFEWLRGVNSVIFDDLLDLSPLRRRLLVALARAWQTAGCHVVFTFEIGQELGGRAAGPFFGYDDLDAVALSLKPFVATRGLRRDLFEPAIGEGHGALLLATEHGVFDLDPALVPESELDADPDLADRMYQRAELELGDAPELAIARATGDGRVRLLRCADPDAELRAIARDIKERLLSGVRPGDCALALADLGARSEQLRAVLNDHGVPFSFVGGQALDTSPVTRVVRRLASLPLRGWPAQEFLELLRSDLVYRPSALRTDALISWCRAAGVRGGPLSSWEEPLRKHLEGRFDGDELKERLKTLHAGLGALDEVCAHLAPLGDPATPEEYRERLLHAVDKLGLSRRVGKSDEHPEVALRNLRAWGAILRQIDGMVADLRVVHGDVWPAADLFDLLDRALRRGTYLPEAGGAGRVQVLHAVELRGLYPPRVWLGGLIQGAFPALPETPFLLPRRLMREVQPLDPVAEARYIFCSLLRNTLADPELPPVSLTLSWPAARDGAELAPSPLLEDLLHLPTSAGVPLGKLAVTDAPAEPREPRARSDLLRAAARDEAWRSLLDPAARARVDDHRLIASSRAANAPFGPFDGIIAEPPAPPEQLPVTAMETFMKCPARYWFGRVMRLGPPEEWAMELAADRRGTVLHRILEELMRRRELRSLEGERDVEGAAALLYKVAVEQLGELEQEGGFDPHLFRYNRERWTAGLIDDKPKGILRAWLDAEIGGTLGAAPLAVEHQFKDLRLNNVLLTGKIDRMDRVDGGIVVTDYKTGEAPSSELVRRGLALQPVAYAEAVAEHYPGEAVASHYYVLKDPRDLKRTGWVGDEALVGKLAGKTRPVKLDVAHRRELWAYAGQAARRLTRGRFHTTMAGPEQAGCERCDFARICRVDHGRNGCMDAARGDFQAPLKTEGGS